MDRRGFIQAGLAAGIGLIGASSARAAAAPAKHQFKLKYAPHVGLFEAHVGKDPVEQIKCGADYGFTAWEDNGMPNRTREEQVRMAADIERQGMTMGVFVAHADFPNKTFVMRNDDVRKMLIEQMKAAVELAPRVRAKWCTVVPDLYDPQQDWDYQTATVVDHLKACAEILEPAGLVMVLEPLNKMNHPGMFLTKVSQGYQICKAVGSPSCKILDDLYHQQVTEGNLISNLDFGWDEIAYIQVGDAPGRKEPGTGEINYRNVFRHLARKGYEGVVGMEHGLFTKSLEGERALVRAYVEADSFEI